MNILKSVTSAAVVALVGSLSTPTNAEVITYLFEDDLGRAGTFSFDDTTATFGGSRFGGTGYTAISWILDGTSLVDPQIGIFDNFGGDQYLLVTDANGRYLQLGHFGLDLFSSDALTEATSLSLADFDNTETNDLQSDGLEGTVTSFRLEGGVSAVPLPAALPILASGLAAFGLFGWRRRHPETA
ncbi:MAG: PEP-CTERM sorting domain-containing protein [Pseudomonadota bacterium]